MNRAKRFTEGEACIACEVIGSGPDTLVVIAPSVSHLDYDWETPEIRALRGPR